MPGSTLEKRIQGYYPFCVPSLARDNSLEGIKKAVIPSREGTQLAFFIPSREGTQPPIIPCKGRDTKGIKAALIIPSFQGILAFFIPSRDVTDYLLQKIMAARKAVIPSRDTSHYLLQGKGHNKGLSKKARKACAAIIFYLLLRKGRDTKGI